MFLLRLLWAGVQDPTRGQLRRGGEAPAGTTDPHGARGVLQRLDNADSDGTFLLIRSSIGIDGAVIVGIGLRRSLKQCLEPLIRA